MKVKSFYYPGIIFIIHLIGWIQLFVSHSYLSLIILLCISGGISFYYRNELKQMRFLLAALPIEETIYIVGIQIVFLLIVILAGTVEIQVVGMCGILFCELIRIKLYPRLAKEKEQIVQFEAKITEMNEQFLTIRSQRHDFLKHVNAIDYLIDQDASVEVKRYFRELLGEYQGINQTIKGEEAHIAAILLKEKKRAEKNGTKVVYKLDAPVSVIPMNKIDQVQFVTNLVENAVEGAQSYHMRFNRSSLNIRTEIHGGIYIFEIKNSAYFPDKHLLDKLFDSFEISTKGENHQGLGTFIISKLVESHHGRLSYNYFHDELLIKIKLPLIVGNEKSAK